MATLAATKLVSSSLCRPGASPPVSKGASTCSHLAGGRLARPRAERAFLGKSFGLAEAKSSRCGPQRLVTSANWRQWIDFTAVPAWLVKQIAMAVYPADSQCQVGRYEDPNTHACVYICKEGYEYDPVLRGAFLLPLSPTSHYVAFPCLR